MNRMEMLEPRLLLSTTLLSGETAVLDFDSDLVNDAVLTNTGAVAIEYDVTGGNGLAIELLSDGAAFQTNTWVNVFDTNAGQDFDLLSADAGMQLLHDLEQFNPILGSSMFDVDTVDTLTIHNGDLGLLDAQTLDGATIEVINGEATHIKADQVTGATYFEAGAIGTFEADLVSGESEIVSNNDLTRLDLGTLQDSLVVSGGNLTEVEIDLLTSTDVETEVTVGGGVDSAKFGQIIAGQADVEVNVLEELVYFKAGLISGGDQGGTVDLSFNKSVETFCLGTLTGGLNSAVEINVSGSVDYFWASRINGGHATADQSSSVDITIGQDLHKLKTRNITGGQADGDFAETSVGLTVGNDLNYLKAYRTITAGQADGLEAYSKVQVVTGRDIGVIKARQIDGGNASGDGAMTKSDFLAGRHIKLICANRIIGAPDLNGRGKPDPLVKFEAGGDIHKIYAGRISGGAVNAEGPASGEAAVVFHATGVAEGTLGDIHKVYVGTLSGGRAIGDSAESSVTIHAAHDIKYFKACYVTGGRTAEGGYAFVHVLAEHDIWTMKIGTLRGSENPRPGYDPAVEIHAYNDLHCFSACRIIAGEDGVVNILAGLDGDGNVSGDTINDVFVPGSIGYFYAWAIYGSGGEVNVAAGGNIDYMKVCKIVPGDGKVSVQAGGDITARIGRVYNGWWSNGDLLFAAAGQVFDVWGAIPDNNTVEGQPVVFPDPLFT